jgi:hypothetical protein
MVLRTNSLSSRDLYILLRPFWLMNKKHTYFKTNFERTNWATKFWLIVCSLYHAIRIVKHFLMMPILYQQILYIWSNSWLNKNTKNKGALFIETRLPNWSAYEIFQKSNSSLIKFSEKTIYVYNTKVYTMMNQMVLIWYSRCWYSF